MLKCSNKLTFFPIYIAHALNSHFSDNLFLEESIEWTATWVFKTSR